MDIDFDFPYSLADFLNEECDCQGEQLLIDKQPRLVYSTRKVKTPMYSYPLHYHANDNSTPYPESDEDEALCASQIDTTAELASISQ